jgi:hypothetical protein
MFRGKTNLPRSKRKEIEEERRREKGKPMKKAFSVFIKSNVFLSSSLSLSHTNTR